MQPPGPGREDGLAAGQVFVAGISVLVNEGLIALECLDSRPGILAGDARRELAARLARAGAGVPVLLQDRLAPEQLDSPLPTLGSSFLLGLDGLVTQKLGGATSSGATA